MSFVFIKRIKYGYNWNEEASIRCPNKTSNEVMSLFFKKNEKRNLVGSDSKISDRTWRGTRMKNLPYTFNKINHSSSICEMQQLQNVKSLTLLSFNSNEVKYSSMDSEHSRSISFQELLLQSHKLENFYSYGCFD